MGWGKSIPTTAESGGEIRDFAPVQLVVNWDFSHVWGKGGITTKSTVGKVADFSRVHFAGDQGLFPHSQKLSAPHVADCK